MNATSVETPALVYVRGPRGPTPQVWREPQSDIDGYWRGRVLAAHRLSAFTCLLSIATLAGLFPPPSATAERKVPLP